MLTDWWPKHTRSVTCQSEFCVDHSDTMGVCQGVCHGSVGFKLRAGGSLAELGTVSLRAKRRQTRSIRTNFGKLGQQQFLRNAHEMCRGCHGEGSAATRSRLQPLGLDLYFYSHKLGSEKAIEVRFQNF